MGGSAECSGSKSGEPRGPAVLSVIIVNAAVDALVAHGLPVGTELAGMRDRFLADPHAVVSRRVFLDELERACAAHPDRGIALAMGESLNALSFHYVGHMITSQTSLRDTTDIFLQLARDVLGGPRWILQRQGDDVVVGYEPERELGPGAQREAELYVAAIQRSLTHWLGAGGRLAVRAQFSFAAPSYLARYRASFGTQLGFREPLTGVRFPAVLLDRVRPGASAELASELRELGERWLPREEESWTQRVRRELAGIENLSNLSFDELSWRWGFSSRSLRRRLASESASFTTLLEEARITRAKALLAGNEHSLTEIANLLGYWEVNSFQRAFKRWVHITPGVYRAQAQRIGPASA